MLSLSLIVIRRLRWEGVSHKLRIEIARMIGLFERKPEIVHGKHVFQELRLLEVPYSARLTSRIEQVRQRIRARVETVVVLRLVDSDSPKNDGWMIPVPPDHAANVIDRNLFPGLRTNMLPPRDLLQYQKSDLIAAVKKVPRLRIMRCPHNIAMQIFPQNHRIFALCPGAHGLPRKGKCLMTIQSPQLDDLSVERESVVRKR